jgi:FkbM family methyltransferase
MELFSSERLLGRILRLPLRLIPSGTVVPILTTRARGKHWIAGSGPHSCWLGWNEFRKRALFSREVVADSVVFDIGANVGSYAILASVLVGPKGHVVAFEPVDENVGFLRRHIELNHLENVRVVPAAVSAHTGEVRFAKSPDRLQGRISQRGTDVFPSVSVDEFVQDAGVPAPDFLKIDVEGGELEVLNGATEVLRHVRPVIFLATHSDEVLEQCRRILTGAGYTLASIAGHGDEWIARPGGI